MNGTNTAEATVPATQELPEQTSLVYRVHHLKHGTRFQLVPVAGQKPSRQVEGYATGRTSVEVRLGHEEATDAEWLTHNAATMLRQLADELEAKSGTFIDSRNLLAGR